MTRCECCATRSIPRLGSEELIRRFYTHWFAIDIAVRDLFPPDMGTQFNVFAQALTWLFGELIAQRADEPVAFLAQLGRDHRKYGVTQSHYDSMHEALLHHAAQSSDRERGTTSSTTPPALLSTLIIGVMRGAADAEKGPPFCDGTVVEHNRASRDVSVIRLQLDQPLAYHPGQYVDGPSAAVAAPMALPESVDTPPTPAVPSSSTSARSPVAWSARRSSAKTRPGDRWRLSNPHGAMQIDRDAGDVLMVAGSTGLAPLRALIMDLTRWGVNPRVHLFFGARYPCELYDLRTLWQIASTNPWLSVSPVSEFAHDPPWAADYPDVQPPRGLHVRQTGKLPEVVTRYGNWGDRQILICGGPEMVAATKAALIAKGAPAERIQHDPLAS